MMSLRSTIALSLLLAVSSVAISCQVPKRPIPLWKGIAPGDTAGIPEEADTTKPNQDPDGKRVIRLGNVSVPTIQIFKPAPSKDTGASVVVCPGGGYFILAMDLEGTEVCEWLNKMGVTGILLKYRVPGRPNRERWAAPLQDAQRAIGMARSNAKAWGLNPSRIGILGFSAGGHLAASASNNFTSRSYPDVDDADRVSCRPDFTVLIYPAYLTTNNQGMDIAPDLKITAQTPPAFVVMTQDDPVRVENAYAYSLALKNAKVACELHLYPKGGHGYGLRKSENDVTTWPDRAEKWLRSMGMLGVPKSN